MKNNYVNLKYLIQYHPYHISTFAEFAHVTTELLEEALAGRAELTAAELSLISKYVGVPVSVLNCPKLITLHRNRFRHWAMVCRLHSKHFEIERLQEAGSHEADMYMKYFYDRHRYMISRFADHQPIPYCQYLGMKSRIDNTLSSIAIEQDRIYNKPRGVKCS